MGSLPISKFRKDLFTHVESAAKGETVEFLHKGIRFHLVQPDGPATDKLSRINPLTADVLIGTSSELVAGHRKMSEEVVGDWEAGWSK